MQCCSVVQLGREAEEEQRNRGTTQRKHRKENHREKNRAEEAENKIETQNITVEHVGRLIGS